MKAGGSSQLSRKSETTFAVVIVTEPKSLDPPPTTVMVCVNRRFRVDEASCGVRGSEKLADALESGIQQRRINIKLERSICMGHCLTGPTIRLAPGGRFFHGPTSEEIAAILDELEEKCGTLDPADSDAPLFMPGS